ncbi:hypothetical protein C8Q78DRAFT_993986 [Trametes maxima]|nr:hypothetical protein C8Q78DRAFT_993986 [Trametes maxima]
MYMPMPPRYAADQDYYPPLSTSSSPRSHSPPPASLQSRSRSPSAPSFLGVHRSSHAYLGADPGPYRAPTSIPLDDNFDAPTTEAPTEWAPLSARHGRDGHPEYDESVTGYQNYVVEMERMLEGQMESAARAQEAYRDRDRDRGRQRELPLPLPPPPHPRSQISPPPPSQGVRSPALEYTSNGKGSGGGGGRRASTSPALRRIDTTLSESAWGSSTRPGRRTHQHPYPHRRQHSPAPAPPPPPPMSPGRAAPQPENARQVSGKKGRIELVEQRVLEDSAARTISLWRERVAASSVGGSRCGDSAIDGSGGGGDNGRGRRDEERNEVGSHMHRRVPSGSVNGDPRLRRVVSDHAKYTGSVQGGGSRNGNGSAREKGGKAKKAAYERSEYMVSYQNAKDGVPKELFSPRSDAPGLPPLRDLRTPSSPTTNRTYDRAPSSPTLRRHAARKSLDRSEYMMAYPQTPPLTDSQASSGSPTGKHAHRTLSPAAALRSPLHGSFRDMHDALSPMAASDAASALRVTTTSSVEAILAACDPSLLHIAPVLHELGIKRVDHLRAVARLSEETRDREVKEQALRRGVSVVEWAIFLDKLQSL